MQNNFDSIYILGTHKLALSYRDKIQEAKTQNRLSFKNMTCVGAASEFILDYFQNQKSDFTNDILIPDHTAKHVLLQTYLDLVKKDFPEFKAKLTPFASDFAPPFLYKSENDAIWAMSYATWLCPPDCDEPAICPHIQAKRDWDFSTSLPQLMKNFPDKEYSKHLFRCEVLIDEIAQIPMVKIISEIEKFKKRIAANPPQKVIVATHSHCHGILGSFSLVLNGISI